MKLNKQNLQTLNNASYYSSHKKSPNSILATNDILALVPDEDLYDTENSGYEVSSVDETLLPNNIIAPSTKLLRFPLRFDIYSIQKCDNKKREN